MAYAGDQDHNEIIAAFIAATKILEFSGLQLVVKNEISLADVDRSLQKLEKLNPSAKLQLLRTCTTPVLYMTKKYLQLKSNSYALFRMSLGVPCR